MRRYYCCPTEDKPRERMDREPLQWLANGGTPKPLLQCVPGKLLGKDGEPLMQKRNMTAVQAMELCRANDALTEKDIWAFAEQLREDGDKGLIGFLMETNESRFAAKVGKAAGAKAEREREKMTRVQILEEAAAGKVPCICPEPDACYGQMKAQLRRNGLDGPFQRLVYTALQVGRCKKEGSCGLTGASDSGKTFLLRPLGLIYKVYKPPDPEKAGNYPLMTLPGKEVITFNDFAYEFDGKLPDVTSVGNDLQGYHGASLFGLVRPRLPERAAWISLESSVHERPNIYNVFDSLGSAPGPSSRTSWTGRPWWAL